MKIFVTGIGVISAAGLTSEENLSSLQSLSTGISKSTGFNLMLGQISLTNEQLVNEMNLANEDYSRTTLLALPAIKEAWGNNKHEKNVRTGLISSTSVGGLDRTEKYYFQSRLDNFSDCYLKMTHDNGRITEQIAAVIGIAGHIGTVSTACSSGANAIMQGARLINAKKLDRVIVGGTEPLAAFDIKGFSSLNIYDSELCKPFDDNRAGLNLGEGAGYLLLENEHSISVTGNKPLCCLLGWSNATDAYHQTASSPEGIGAYMAMVNALSIAQIEPCQINYVNAHGTGTENNDLSESMALKKMFGNAMPAFSSTKGFTGHTLAAAGAIEAVYCVQSILSQALLPNLNFSTPMKETKMIPVTNFCPSQIDFVLSNSFGFGGNCTCLIFGKV